MAIALHLLPRLHRLPLPPLLPLWPQVVRLRRWVLLHRSVGLRRLPPSPPPPPLLKGQWEPLLQSDPLCSGSRACPRLLNGKCQQWQGPPQQLPLHWL